MTKIFEADALISAMEKRSNEYQEFKEKLLTLKKAFLELADLESFQGKGANAIKSFYQEQAVGVDGWIDLVDEQLAFFDSVSGYMEGENVSGNTVVQLPFLEDELSNGIMNGKNIVNKQRAELKETLHKIDDLVTIQPFSKSSFYSAINDADRKLRRAREAVQKVDHQLKSEYQSSEANQDYVRDFFQQLTGATGKGKPVTPINFDAAAFHKSEVYQRKQKIDKQTDEYLARKEREAEERKIEQLKKELETIPPFTKEYVEKADEIGMANFSPEEQQQIVQMAQSLQMGDIFKGVGVGLFDAGKDFVVGIYDFVTNPGGTVEAVVNSVTHPEDTYNQISKAIADSYERDMVNGDAYSRSHWVSYALGTIAASVLGTKGAGAVSKTGIATTKQAAKTGITKTKTAIQDRPISNLLPYAPQHQVAAAGASSGIPYNAVNGVGLRDQLITMAKKERALNRKPFTGKEVNIPWLNKDRYGATDVEGYVKVGDNVKDVSRRVYTLKDIDIHQKNEFGVTNLELMKNGNAPYAKDGTQINLHHLIQEEPGTMLEIPNSLHSKYSKVIHGLRGNGESFRNNKELKKQYDHFRARYWKWRAKQFEN
ncbi:T7SS effector LXG polymorphic toxin [Bacillus gobiensis]|uniref:T7SS effector LXG polymorphic toxin n=1 Tax=Bacillus gobiensis TaxID=1441095 RepID=UPI003D224322